MDFLFGLGFGLLALSLLYLLYFRKRINETRERNADVDRKNEALRLEQQELLRDLGNISERIQQENTHFNNLLDKSKQSAEQLFEQEKKEILLRIELLEITEKERFEQAIEDYKGEYLSVITELVDESGSYREEAFKVVNELKKVQELRDANVEAFKREEQIKRERDFFRLTLSENDVSDIGQIKSIEARIFNREVLNKIIWKVYFESPFTDMVGRVLGNRDITGVYKITNLVNNMCYVGQAANVKDRWKTHIKRGLGCETGPQLKIYSAMAEYGLENFTWELVVECSRENLSEQERYWIDLYHANTYGYNMTKGG